jgi:N-acyl-L-homoserine lactone synthetase
MFKVHILKRDEFHLFAPLINTMLADRKTVFMDELKWTALRANHMGWERDEYDTPERADAIYVILEHLETGRHLASGRLLPTTSPHMLHDHFNYCVVDQPYISDQTWELTRLCLAPQKELKNLGISMRESRRFIDMLATNACDFALKNGITHFVGIMDRFTYRYYQKNKFSIEKMAESEEGYIVARWDIRTKSLPNENSGSQTAPLHIAASIQDLLPKAG